MPDTNDKQRAIEQLDYWAAGERVRAWNKGMLFGILVASIFVSIGWKVWCQL